MKTCTFCHYEICRCGEGDGTIGVVMVILAIIMLGVVVFSWAEMVGGLLQLL